MEPILSQAPSPASAWDRIVSEVSPPYLAILLILGWVLRSYHLDNKDRREREKKNLEDITLLTREVVKFLEVVSQKIAENNTLISRLEDKINDDENS